MATRKPAANSRGDERVAIAVLETKFDILKETVEVGFRELKAAVEAASLNGQTPRVKNMSAQLGDPDTIAALAAMVEGRRRWEWAAKPFASAGSQVRSALLWGGGALILAWLHAILHGAWPAVP